MLRLSVCFLVFTVFLQTSPAYASPTDDLQFAAALFNDGEYRQALDEFIKIRTSLAGGEWEDDVIFWMAECHYNLREFDSALDLYRSILSGYPGFSRLEEVYAKILGTYYSDGRFQNVMETAESFARKYPASSYNDQVYLLWIQSALRLKQFARADELLDAYQKRSPQSPYLWSLKSILANFYLKEQRFDRALPFFEELYRYQKDANFLLWIGECRFQNASWAAARDAFVQYLQEEAQSEVARFKWGLCEYRLKNFAAAVEALQPLASKQGTYTEDALYFVAQAMIQLGNASGAKENLSSILKLSPNEELRRRAVAQLLSLEVQGGKGDIEKMMKAYEKYSGAAGAGATPPINLQQYRVFTAYQKQDFQIVVSLLRRPQDRREVLMLAESLYALGRYAEASQMYEQLLSESATPVEKRSGYLGLAWCLYATEHYEDALKNFDAYIQLDPAAPPDVHLAMAQCAMAGGRTENVVKFYEQARKAAPDERRVARNLAILYFNSADYTRAAEVIAPIADDDQSLSILGRSYLYLKQADKAMTVFRRLKQPKNHALEIGAVHYELGQMEEAKTYFEQASQTAGSAGAANTDEFLGIIAYNQGNYADAATRLRRAQLRDPNNIEIRFELAASLMRVENAPQQELVEILRSLSTDPRVPRGQRDKARMWLARKSVSTDIAREMADIGAIENAADRSAALSAKAAHFFANQSYDTAMIFYDKLLNAPDVSTEDRMQALYGLGWSMHKIGRKESAREKFRQLLQEYPKSSYASEVVLMLVEDAYAAGRYAEAAEMSLKYVNKVTKNAGRLKFMAAESMFELGRYNDALMYYRVFLPEADSLESYVRYRSGLCAYNLRQFDRCIENFSVITDSSLLERKHYYLGMSYYETGKRKQAAEQFEKVVERGAGDYQQEAWKNLVILMEELGQWKKIIGYGSRLSESPNELDRLIYAKALYHTASDQAGRYAEKLGYIAREPDIAAESLYLAAMSYAKTDPARAKPLAAKVISKYPNSRFADEARKLAAGL